MTAPSDEISASGHSTFVESFTSITDSFDCNPPALIAGGVIELVSSMERVRVSSYLHTSSKSLCAY